MNNNIPSYISGALFMKAYRLLRANVVACLEHYDLIPTSWTMLGVIDSAKNGIRLNEVAAALSVKAPLITTMADSLIDRGVIDRIPHPIDKRAKLLIITPRGKNFIKKVEADMQIILGNLLQGTSDAELLGFQKTLEVIIANNQL